MRVSKLSGMLAGAAVLAMGVTVAAQRGERGSTQTQERGSTSQQTQERGSRAGQAAPRSGSEQARNEVCPADIQNLQVQTAQVENGGALVFTTSEANSRELRQRLTRFVQMHEQVMQQQGSQGMQQPGSRSGSTGGSAGMQAQGGSTGGSAGMQAQGGSQGGSAGMQAQGGSGSQRGGGSAGATGSQQRRFADMQALIHQGRAEMIEIPNGAVLLFSTQSRDQVSQLQNELRQDAQALQQGRCPLSLQIETGA